jgi:DAACS family dicarboxylate/amino acid:cation (Na+ or H+) symporter
MSGARLQTSKKSLFAYYHQTPLYIRIIIALAFGLIIGIVLGYLNPHVLEEGIQPWYLEGSWPFAGKMLAFLSLFSKIILQLLGALAPPLILIAVIHVLVTTEIPGRSAGRLAWLLLLNTTVAILIGLLVSNLMQPGRWSSQSLAERQEEAHLSGEVDPIQIIVNNVPKSFLGPLGDQSSIIGVIFIAVSFGIALRRAKNLPLVHSIVETAYDALIVILHWIIDLVPLGVFCVVANIVGTKGFSSFISLGGLVITVIVALLLQTLWYLLRIRFFSWCNPFKVLKGMRDALLMAFSTGSSTATMPVTFKCLRENVGLREKSASLGSLVGANFNNDGTALYEATAAIFVAQQMNIHLTLTQQFIIVLTSIVASVGAAGIPEAGLVTMTLVFTAVGLPIEVIPVLLTVDWFLDRCRTTVNVMGDVNVSCILDGMTSEHADQTSSPVALIAASDPNVPIAEPIVDISKSQNS